MMIETRAKGMRFNTEEEAFEWLKAQSKPGQPLPSTLPDYLKDRVRPAWLKFPGDIYLGPDVAFSICVANDPPSEGDIKQGTPTKVKDE